MVLYCDFFKTQIKSQYIIFCYRSSFSRSTFRVFTCAHYSPHRYGRRANAIILLDRGLSCTQVADILLLDDNTVRQWYRYWIEDGFDGLMSFGFGGSDGYLSREQSDILYDWVCRT